ncbi:hypothetical protein [Acinetobacter sp. ANC 4648]|uniref:hypothetical protein n=1 Tax=Acinetobacter sp. ANC 4648 TaxID=1977875 RepID=UPI000A35956D|nr:hypothetical protein [Acinetobacter sp. ANC 4648]OTG83545.1 hypothetical protein B9T27_03235 [Acinetobacter sp. ANC 4648]
MKRDSVFNPNDHEVYAALTNHKVSKIELAKLFLKRGIIISPKDEKDKSARYFSSFFLSYFDLQDIHDCVSSASNRREMLRTNGFQSESKINISEVIETLNTFKESKESTTEGEGKLTVDSVKVTQQGDDILVNFSYSSFNWGNSEFTRRVNKRTAFRLRKIDDKTLYLDTGTNEEAKQWSAELSELLETSNALVKDDEINLLGVTSQKSKRTFFDRLTKEIDGYELADVIKVDVIKPNDEGDDPEAEKPGYKIKSAKFHGEGLMQSKELDELISQGFHLYRISWECTQTSSLDLDLYQFEARFNDTENCSGFEYIVKGFKRHTNNGYTSKPTSLSSSEEISINTKLFQAANKILGTLSIPPINTPDSIELECNAEINVSSELTVLTEDNHLRDGPIA